MKFLASIRVLAAWLVALVSGTADIVVLLINIRREARRRRADYTPDPSTLRREVR